MNFCSAIDSFLSYMTLSRGISEHTVRGYRLDFNAFLAFVQDVDGAAVDWPHISKRLIRRYLASLYDKRASTATILRRLSSLRSFYRHAMREKWVLENPLEEIDSPKKGKKLPCSISYTQIEHLFKQPDLSTYVGRRDRTIMELFYSSGLRLSELVGLNRADFDQKNQILTIFGKGKKQRQAKKGCKNNQ